MKNINKDYTNNMERIDKASLLKVIDEANVKLKGNLLRIKRHIDTTILIYDENDKVIYEPVKPILREINHFNNLR